MLQFFFMGGIFMWPLLILLIVVIVLSIKKTIELFGKADAPGKNPESGVNAIIFCGVLSLAVGFLAHYLGLFYAITGARDISPPIFAMGYAVSLAPVIFGFIIFIVSAVVWFFLRWKCKKIS
jgi:hypothetical protein